MDTGKFVGLLVFGLVGILVLSAFIPILTETTSATDTLENDGYFHMEKYGTDENIIISWDHTKPKVITVNEEEMSITGLPINQWVSLVVGDTWGLRYANGGTLFFSSFAYGTMQSIGASTQDNKDLTIVCENGTATATLYTSGTAGTSATVTYSEIYVIANDGDYVMKKNGESVYMGGDSPIVAFGNTTLDVGYACMISIRGTIADGVTPTVLASTTGEAELVADSVTVNTTDLTSYIGYSLENIQFNISDRGTEYPATYSYFIVPSEVTLERSTHMDSTLATIINLLPLIAGVGLLMFLVAEFLYTRYL